MNDLKPAQGYRITISTTFTGEFVGYRTDQRTGVKFADFETAGYTKLNERPLRSVPVVNIIDSEEVERV